ncbi:Long-chain-fatty-acid--CoA ligase FadD13 [Pseudooceanicola marinus]|uniref:Long-chain-fatty-acid--CoA ligase FadD13 n=1 Tax=Pseudooceanicola marinus TaxID=396013 RepID=A0A1X6ZSR4_9RHOB|nr:class I adenylate-forming enzyme family protein [Pseudooceanicola marinus]SLN60673.1 Long-chain-fatty-acid--CoA ligase FadD13 [Pseudooceanicola marinus]
MTDMTEVRLRAAQVPDEIFVTFGKVIAENGARLGDRPAVTDETGTMSWADFAALAARIAGRLAERGIGPGHRVASLSENSAAHLALYAGVLSAGACMVPLPFSASDEALAKMRADCGAELLFTSAPQAPRAAALGAEVVTLEDLHAWAAGPEAAPRDVTPDDLFDIIYSSGTTGTPKGIQHEHRFRSRQFGRFTVFGLDTEAVQIMSTPLYSNTTLVAVLSGLVGGGHVVSMAKFDTLGFLDLAARHRATHAMLVPVQYTRLMKEPQFDSFDLSAFQCKFSTSAPLPGVLIKQVMTRWPGNLVEFYGMTEGGVTTVLDCAAHPDKWDTAGIVPEGNEVKIIDEEGRELPPGEFGEIVGRSGSMTPGYLNLPNKTAELLWRDAAGNDFIRTGDMGRLDEDGFLHLMDRRKDMIISGGFNVYAADLEAVLRHHPAVADVAVIAVPSEDWGETPLALVVPEGSPDPEEIRTWANARLGKLQRISEVEFRDHLPRSEIGKILKRELRVPYWDAVKTAEEV